MQALRFTHSLKRIVAELKAKELVQFLDTFLVQGRPNQPITQDAKNAFSSMLFESRVAFAALEKDPDAAKILADLQLNDLYDPARLGKLLSTFSAQAATQGIWGTHENFVEFFSFSTVLLWLIKLSATCSRLLEAERIGEPVPDTTLVEIELVDYDGTGIEAARVNQFFASLTELHTLLCRTLGITDDHLKIIYLDSGSNLLAGIQAGKSIVEALVLLFKEFWEKIKYARFDDFDRKVESLSKGLTFAATLQQQIDNNVVDAETGRILKHRVLSEMTTLIGIGAMLPENEVSERVDQTKLLAEKKGVKLLGTGGVDSP